MRFSFDIKNGQIASVNDFSISNPALPNQILKVGVHLRSPASNVDGRNLWSAVQDLYDLVDGVFGHTFGSLRPGIYMTMMASLVTNFSHIHLKGRDGVGFEGLLPIGGQGVFKGGHGY